MKVRTLIITAGATLALVVPVAASAQILDAQRMLPAVAGHASGKTDAATITTLKAQNKALQAQSKALKAKQRALQAENTALRLENSALRTELNGNRVEPEPRPTNPVDDRQEYCYGHMLDCTDEELCTIWGINCGAVAPTVTTPVEESPVVAPVEETAVADSSQNTASLPELPSVEVTPDPVDPWYYDGF